MNISPIVAFYLAEAIPVALILLIVVLWIGDAITDHRDRRR